MTDDEIYLWMGLSTLFIALAFVRAISITVRDKGKYRKYLSFMRAHIGRVGEVRQRKRPIAKTDRSIYPKKENCKMRAKSTSPKFSQR